MSFKKRRVLDCDELVLFCCRCGLAVFYLWTRSWKYLYGERSLKLGLEAGPHQAEPLLTVCQAVPAPVGSP